MIGKNLSDFLSEKKEARILNAITEGNHHCAEGIGCMESKKVLASDFFVKALMNYAEALKQGAHFCEIRFKISNVLNYIEDVNPEIFDDISKTCKEILNQYKL